MSRRAELMDKPLTFRTLSDLVFDFEDSYKKYLHTVKKVKIGLYVPHEPHSFQPIEWKQLVLNVSKMLRADIRKELEKYARDLRMKVSAGTRAWCVGVFHLHLLLYTQDKIPDPGIWQGGKGVWFSPQFKDALHHGKQQSCGNLKLLSTAGAQLTCSFLSRFGFSHISVLFPTQSSLETSSQTHAQGAASPVIFLNPVKRRIRI